MGTQKLQIDSSHCRAICDEVGERLRPILSREPPVPLSLQLLIDRLAELDHEPAPSIAPSIADMISQPATDSFPHRAARAA
jgi:hypothetical protein